MGRWPGARWANSAKQYGRDLVGQAACFDDRFPLLVKFLFPGDKLSVQVHPDDEQAQQDRPALRKNRMLVCVARAARRSSCAGIEARRDVWSNSNRQFEDTRAEELLNWVDVHQGDMLYVAAGTVHTIGGGMVLVETQQTSDITYRLYDYGRGRELHIAEGLAATKLQTKAGKVVPRPRRRPRCSGALAVL